MYQDDPFTRVPGRITPDKVSPLGTKWCSRCDTVKPLTEFNTRIVKKIGFDVRKTVKIPLNWCKSCAKENRNRNR